MQSPIYILLSCLILLSCSSTDDPITQEENEDPIAERQYLTAFTSVGETTTDTLVYANNTLILRKEYVGDFLDYNHHFIYNNSGELIKISKIHSTSTFPSRETTYTYYSDGNLKTRHFVGYNSDYTQTFTYRNNAIYIDEGTTNAIRMNLNAAGYIVSADRFYDDVQDFINFINFEYDANGNVTVASQRFSRNDPYRTFNYTFDDKLNPLFVFDYKLPNGLTIKQLEAVDSHPNFGGYSPGDDDNLIVYFNKNNISSVESADGIGTFNFEYNIENYPTKIVLPHSNGDAYLTLMYQ
ncbi:MULTISPECIES: hypothetical protein [Aequorivita]|uniref:DUF4595 domain-containing protein n=2 Tax=Aequorivita TaxID=153265 RepID=A0AB35YMD5_9FLAO|nr:hypothetical protein [Aequorivita sp. Ant34-E75]WGF91429.1 hypothetical protein QCQ61_09405 [Aequorivita sp. Ant34-E75]